MKNYEFYGIRIDYEHYYEVGDIHDPSHQWWQDDPEDGCEFNEEESAWDGGVLNGTSAFACTLENIDEAVQYAKAHFVGHAIYLVGGNISELGNDKNEIIIQDAEILQVIE